MLDIMETDTPISNGKADTPAAKGLALNPFNYISPATENDVAFGIRVLIVFILLIPTFYHDMDEGGKGDKTANGSKKPTGKGSTTAVRRLDQG